MIFNPLGTIDSLFQALRGGDDPDHIAAGFALGAALGLIPKDNLFGLLFLLLFFFFRVDKGMAVVTAAIFTPIGYAIDPLAHLVGTVVLNAGLLNPLWTFLYNLPIVPFTKFNNTVVMGNLVIGWLLFKPLFHGFKKALLVYRERYQARVEKSRVMRTIDSWRWVQVYQRWMKRFR
jgi:uncharacterized protein (TIGR03546 family)